MLCFILFSGTLGSSKQTTLPPEEDLILSLATIVEKKIIGITQIMKEMVGDLICIIIQR